MKPTKETKELIKKIESSVVSWRLTNDLTSPTHSGDTREEFNEYEGLDNLFTRKIIMNLEAIRAALIAYQKSHNNETRN